MYARVRRGTSVSIEEDVEYICTLTYMFPLLDLAFKQRGGATAQAPSEYMILGTIRLHQASLVMPLLNVCTEGQDSFTLHKRIFLKKEEFKPELTSSPPVLLTNRLRETSQLCIC